MLHHPENETILRLRDPSIEIVCQSASSLPRESRWLFPPIRARFKINNRIIDRANLSIMKNWEMAGLPLSSLSQTNHSNIKCNFIFNFSLMGIR